MAVDAVAILYFLFFFFFFQAEDGIRDLVRSRGLGDVYKRQSTTLLSDFDGNGTMDLVAGTGTALTVLLGNGDGSLSLIHI